MTKVTSVIEPVRSGCLYALTHPLETIAAPFIAAREAYLFKYGVWERMFPPK